MNNEHNCQCAGGCSEPCCCKKEENESCCDGECSGCSCHTDLPVKTSLWAWFKDICTAVFGGIVEGIKQGFESETKDFCGYVTYSVKYPWQNAWSQIQCPIYKYTGEVTGNIRYEIFDSTEVKSKQTREIPKSEAEVLLGKRL
jgi:hypothetical protein